MSSSIEEDVGISCYITSTPPLSAILKQRYSDFLVNEIDCNGNVVQLNSTAVSTSERAPSPAAPAPACSETGNIEPNTAPEAAVVPPEAPPHASADIAALLGYAQLLSGLDKLLPSEGVAAVQQFLTAVEAYERSWAEADAPSDADAPVEKPSSAERVKPPLPITFAVSSNKDERTAVHHFFKQPGLPKCSTETMPAGEDGENCMRLCYHAQRRKRKREAANGVGGAKAAKSGGNNEQVFLPGGPKYCRFALCKENMDSGHALSLLARAVHCSPSCFGVAGTKDKRAVTVQQVTAFKVAPSRLASSNGRLRGMRVGDFELVDEPLHLGDAKGNRFEVTLRDVGAGSLHDVVAAVEAVREDGFINYFGLQRFGSTGGRTHRIGALLLKGEWKAAVDMILGRIEGERSDNDEARRLYLEEGDVSGALKLMQRHLTAERALLEGLRKQKGANFCQALQQIPRNTRTMYVHAYQSRLWNEAASHRVRTFGAKEAVAGDLVLPRDAAEAAPEEEAEAADEQLAQQPERGRLPAEAHVVTEEEAASARYSIDDVVLPLPGCRVQYPRHATAQVYRDLAAKDGIPLDSAPHGVRDFSMTALPGGYRRLLHRPRDLNWRLLRYSDPDAPLALSTLDRLTGVAPPAVNAIESGEEVGAGEKIALQLAFSLPSSTYATMLVRELTKTSTATAFHKSLSQLAK
ncbi:tRNA pseudouridine synthase D [Coccomyxa subellipsoidea C-169]|uniref:tRNA pseudouridine synthase D n=1 Tax=Coccomyxa subellipsoidea (strain C-169) TaxID=574566 RepID=I0Z2X1_COCSC|nr:tRNA pseudouridine synthase D [Coccomyxa subellipsoidea C-169]EIE24990.1 tRNA pseudouridine synthase D [Coccomyxa subellipsoidea C-169]|eukprot:XP_005649534.1 tRNA pseudouridine synthase D [Coccomyxa subellipsoidea C-169]